MARITVRDLGHRYPGTAADDWALRPGLEVEWADGGAYALLGPSGCGKTTLLNIVSGLLRPTSGRIEFDGRDVTDEPTERRDIAQVFQFPIVYDTMTVRDNLAFPLRNRGVDPARIARRITEIATLLELDDLLDRRAAGLPVDAKQKLSLGRGLVREGVNAVLFDEPLTVIDPHIKWRLRANLKALRQRVSFTMVYVTHDQTEALTFADRIVVMHEGRIAQVGTPQELFERPRHTFVGYFIGSPGMNVIPCELQGGQAVVGGDRIATVPFAAPDGQGSIGVRPEFAALGAAGLPAQIGAVHDLGRRRIVDVTVSGQPLKVSVPEDTPIPTEPRLRFDPERTYAYGADGWLLPAAGQGA